MTQNERINVRNTLFSYIIGTDVLNLKETQIPFSGLHIFNMELILLMFLNLLGKQSKPIF